MADFESALKGLVLLDDGSRSVEHCKSVWDLDEFVAATNGKVALFVNRSAGLLRKDLKIEKPVRQAIFDVLAESKKDRTPIVECFVANLLDWCGEQPPTREQCDHCGGRGGFVCEMCDHETDCDECEGKGYFGPNVENYGRIGANWLNLELIRPTLALLPADDRVVVAKGRFVFWFLAMNWRIAFSPLRDGASPIEDEFSGNPDGIDRGELTEWLNTKRDQLQEA